MGVYSKRAYSEVGLIERFTILYSDWLMFAAGINIESGMEFLFTQCRSASYPNEDKKFRSFK